MVLSISAHQRSVTRRMGSRNANSREAYAQAQQWQTQRHSTNPRNDVYVGGTYLGSDPDALGAGTRLRIP